MNIQNLTLVEKKELLQILLVAEIRRETNIPDSMSKTRSCDYLMKDYNWSRAKAQVVFDCHVDGKSPRNIAKILIE